MDTIVTNNKKIGFLVRRILQILDDLNRIRCSTNALFVDAGGDPSPLPLPVSRLFVKSSTTMYSGGRALEDSEPSLTVRRTVGRLVAVLLCRSLLLLLLLLFFNTDIGIPASWRALLWNELDPSSGSLLLPLELVDDRIDRSMRFIGVGVGVSVGVVDADTDADAVFVAINLPSWSDGKEFKPLCSCSSQLSYMWI